MSCLPALAQQVPNPMTWSVVPGGSIQAALTAAKNNNGGGVVMVKKGNYHVTEEMLISSDTTLKCEPGTWINVDTPSFTSPGGPGSTWGGWSLLHNEHMNADAITADAPNLQRDKNISVIGCGFRATDGSSPFHMVEMRQVDRVRIENITCMNAQNCTSMLGSTDTSVSSSTNGIVVTGNTHSSTLIDGIPSTDGIKVGDRVNGPGIPLDKHRVVSLTPNSITLNLATTTTVTGATVGIGAAWNTCWDHWEGPRNLRVYDNSCVSANYGILVTGSSTVGSGISKPAGDGTIVGNRITMVGPNAAAIWINGLGVAGNGVDRITVIGNAISGDGTDGNICWRITGASDGNRVIGNTCNRSGPAVAEVGGSGAVDGGGVASNTLLSGNIYTNFVSNLDPYGAIHNHGTNTTIQNETLRGVYNTAIWTTGDNAAFLGNTLDPGTHVNPAVTYYFVQNANTTIADTNLAGPSTFRYKGDAAKIAIEDARGSGSDLGGAIELKAMNNDAVQVAHAGMRSKAIDGTPGAESGVLIFQARAAGVLTDVGGADFLGGLSAKRYVMVGSMSPLFLGTGEIGMTTGTAGASAPGAAGGKIHFVCGTNPGTLKLVAHGGTSNGTYVILDNIGAGATGC